MPAALTAQWSAYALQPILGLDPEDVCLRYAGWPQRAPLKALVLSAFLPDGKAWAEGEPANAFVRAFEWCVSSCGI